MKLKIDHLDKISSETYHTLMGYVAGYRMKQGLGCLTSEMVDFAAYCLSEAESRKTKIYRKAGFVPMVIFAAVAICASVLFFVI